MPDQKLFEAPFDDVPFATDGLKGVPTYWVENIRGAIFTRGIFKLNFIEHRLDAIEQDIKAVHVLTIAAPQDQLRAWAKYLTEIADRNNLPTGEEEVQAKEEAAQGEVADGQA